MILQLATARQYLYIQFWNVANLNRVKRLSCLEFKRLVNLLDEHWGTFLQDIASFLIQEIFTLLQHNNHSEFYEFESVEPSLLKEMIFDGDVLFSACKLTRQWYFENVSTGGAEVGGQEHSLHGKLCGILNCWVLFKAFYLKTLVFFYLLKCQFILDKILECHLFSKCFFSRLHQQICGGSLKNQCYILWSKL